MTTPAERALRVEWEAFRARRFPPATSDVFADLGLYDSESGGLVSHVVSGVDPLQPLEVDEELTERIVATGSSEHIAYVQALNHLIRSAQQVLEARR